MVRGIPVHPGRFGYGAILSNSVQTKAIAASKKKTDKIDTHTLL